MTETTTYAGLRGEIASGFGSGAGDFTVGSLEFRIKLSQPPASAGGYHHCFVGPLRSTYPEPADAWVEQIDWRAGYPGFAGRFETRVEYQYVGPSGLFRGGVSVMQDGIARFHWV